MTRASFRQADVERMLRAAKKEGALVQIDFCTLVATIVPLDEDDRRNLRQPVRELFGAPDGLENWEDRRGAVMTAARMAPYQGCRNRLAGRLQSIVDYWPLGPRFSGDHLLFLCTTQPIIDPSAEMTRFFDDSPTASDQPAVAICLNIFT